MWEVFEKNGKSAIHVIEEPNDGTRYSHVFEFNFNMKQFTVHKHAFDSGCTLGKSNFALDVEPLLEVEEKIRNLDRFDAIRVAAENKYVAAILANENANTTCSVIRCLGRAVRKMNDLNPPG